MPLYRILLTSMFVFMLLPQSSWARNIYLNGKLINGVRGTTFVNVTTRVDHKGDIYITGRQYKVQYKKTTAQKAKPSQAKRGLPSPSKPKIAALLMPRPTQRYVMVSQRNAPNGSGYQVRIYINGRKVRTVLAQLPQDVFDTTPYLKKGVNRIEVEAIKVKPGTAGNFALFLARGNIAGGQVQVHEPYLLKYKRRGSERKNYRHIYTVTVK